MQIHLHPSLINPRPVALITTLVQFYKYPQMPINIPQNLPIQYDSTYNKYQSTIPTCNNSSHNNMAGINSSLVEYLIFDDFAGDVPPEVSSHKQKQVLFYLTGLVLAEASFTALTVTYHSPGQFTPIILLSTILWLLTWSTIGLKKRYMFSSQYLFWLQISFHTLMYALARLTQRHQFILCGSSMAIIFFIVVELCVVRKVVSAKFFLYLYIWYVLIFYEDMKKLQYASRTNWLMMLMLDIYCFFGIIVFLLVARKWRNFTKYAKWQILCLIYPISIVLVMCFAGSLPEKQFHYSWIWLTFINHGVFVMLCGFIIKNKQLLPFKIDTNKLLDDNRERLFQVSDTYLQKQQNHVQNYRQSMRGSPPLCNCLFCMDQPSIFCYGSCRHAVLGNNCALDILKNDRKQCPMCRLKSNSLFEIERIEGIEFAINNRYRFKTP